MWFIFVAVGLTVLAIGGIYARRRLATALTMVGASARAVRIVRWAMVWLMFGYPLLIIVSVIVALALGRDTMFRFDGLYAAWLFGIPFAWTVLVVLQSVPWLLAIDLAYLVARRRFERAQRWRALGALVVVGAFAIYTPVRIALERGALRVRHHQVGTPSSAPSRPPFRIAFLADIQQDDHTGADRAREVYQIVNDAKPDVVLSGGDWINTGPEHIASSAEAAAMLKSRLGTFSVRGDHEHFAYIDRNRSVGEIEQAMKQHGIAMIANEARWFEHAGKRIAVVFLNYNYIHRSDNAAVAALLASVAAADYKIVVTHQLDSALATLLVDRVDLVLAGHTHGGQVNPVLGFMHVNLARLETELVDGRYQRGRTTVIVTAGVGYSIIPIRYASPGSIELIELSL